MVPDAMSHATSVVYNSSTAEAIMYMAAVRERHTQADDVLERSLATMRFAALLTSPMTRAALFVAAWT